MSTQTTTRKHPQRTMQFYKSYNFRDKDPIIDRVRTIMEDEGESYTDINRESGVSTTTLYNWFKGDVKRPQYATVAAVIRSMGYDFQVVRTNTPFSNGGGKAAPPRIVKRFASGKK